MEVAVRHGVMILAAALMTSACSPMMYGFRPPHYNRRAAPPAEPPMAVAGRWDNIMMLAPGTPLKVLTMDGEVVAGRMVTASARMLRLSAGQAALTIATQDVARIDRGSATDEAGQAARGAIYGAAAVGWLGLLAGRMPPPRIFLAGALGGASLSAGAAAVAPGPATLYLAPEIVQGQPTGRARDIADK